MFIIIMLMQIVISHLYLGSIFVVVQDLGISYITWPTSPDTRPWAHKWHGSRSFNGGNAGYFQVTCMQKNELAYTRTRKFEKINPHGGRLNIKTSSYQYWDPHLKIRRSCDRFIFSMEIPIPEKDGLNIETGPWYWNGNITGDVSQYNGKLCPDCLCYSGDPL